MPDEKGVNLGDFFTLGIGGAKVSDAFATPASLVNLFVSTAMIAGGFFVFILIIYAGFQFIKNTEKGKEEAKQIMTIAMTGLIVMFSAYWIVQIVQIVTGTNIKI